MNIPVFDIKTIITFSRRCYLEYVYYKIDYKNTQSDCISNQILFYYGYNSVIEKLSKKILFEIPDYAEQYFNEQTNSILTIPGITFFIDEIKYNNSKELSRLISLKNKIEEKLNSEGFINNASNEIITFERKKLFDIENKIYSMS